MGINCLPSSAELCIICAGSVAWAMADSRITIRQLANAHAAGTLACLEFGSTEEIVFRQLANAHAAGALACLEFGSTEKIVFRMWRLPGPWLMLLSISSCVRLTTKSLAMLPTKRLSIASKSPFVMLLTSSLSLASKSSRTITIRRKPSSLPRIPMRSAR
ncbi:hypothetical protein BZA05DRAFT_231906 [Tricharina praecox]|uniref:uncharacterized protein n=1 Tax=Tricharina praecox TaxID=43433 RepID=UPI00221E8C42|nr:uncharacterized protein BZA05DRAFT_231906 [Tricharina praecox]KAI5855164.1 hypothetical protein BZA05DRAFT_231906 [Tricharina praecox]